MINLMYDFYDLIGISHDELIKFVSKSENEDDFIKKLHIDECVEQCELNEQESFELKDKILDIAWYKYKKIKEYIKFAQDYRDEQCF